ncbi:PP2C family protein-serine/threonine phosphatase [Actinomadura sp. 21ATH]|uniref:PP2C family protein-serine/threonine phosphatase n=1 Tax=Actinomadura sp. 21ATH TaxID=1735444 RepID=UPI0035BF63A9
MSAPFTRELEDELWNAQPYELLGTAEAVVRTLIGDPRAEVEVLLADYRRVSLIPAVHGGEAVPIDNTPAGRAFAAQEVMREPPAVHLPLSVRGERLGVLSVRAAGDVDTGPGGGLAGAAAALARALQIADAGTDVFRRIRRRSRLTLAAEMMWDLLPGQSYDTAEFELAGQLEPAYAVWGDNFDWAVDRNRLILTVSNGMGNGTESAALTQLAVSALRNARRSGAGIAEQAALADQILYARHRGTRHVATLLMDYTPGTGRFEVVDAGSPRVFRMRDGATEAVEFDAQLPLGMFGDVHYRTEEFGIERGDRLVIASDGVHGARSPGGERFGENALPRALRDTRLQKPAEAVRTLIRQFLAFHQDSEAVDDAVIVCLDRLDGDRVGAELLT